MPEILLTPHEAEGNLPNVCMCCGERATTRVTRTFLAREPAAPGPSVFWEVFAVRLLIAAADTPRFRLRTSFCDQHSNYWALRSYLLFGGLAGMFVVLALGAVVVALLMTVGKVDAPWLSCCMIGPFLLFMIVWIIPVMRMKTNSIVARLADNDAVLLKNVDESYIAAVRSARRPPRPPPLPDSYDYPGKNG